MAHATVGAANRTAAPTQTNKHTNKHAGPGVDHGGRPIHTFLRKPFWHPQQMAAVACPAGVRVRVRGVLAYRATLTILWVLYGPQYQGTLGTLWAPVPRHSGSYMGCSTLGTPGTRICERRTLPAASSAGTCSAHVGGCANASTSAAGSTRPRRRLRQRELALEVSFRQGADGVAREGRLS
jgi:hypothetical protein